MTTPFLLRFTRVLVARLREHGLLEVAEGREEQVALFTAARLHGLPTGHSLVSTTVAALLACPDVVELYADDDELKRAIGDLSW